MSIENFYHFVTKESGSKCLTLHNLTFAKFTCPIDENELNLWSPHDYIVYVLSGKKGWQIGSELYTLCKGEAAYIKRGCFTVHQHLEEEFCLLFIFIEDGFRKHISMDIQQLKSIKSETENRWLIPIHQEKEISLFFESMLTHISHNAKLVNDPLLSLKLNELIQLLYLDEKNHSILSCLLSDDIHLSEFKSTIEQNYLYSLTLEEFAQLTHRSISTFKRDFNEVFKQPPSKWFIGKRLEHAAQLLKKTQLPISQVALDSGFTNSSHFSHRFKLHFKMKPLEFRKSSLS